MRDSGVPIFQENLNYGTTSNDDYKMARQINPFSHPKTDLSDILASFSCPVRSLFLMICYSSLVILRKRVDHSFLFL